VKKNKDSRKNTFNIFNLDENKKLDAGELFFMHKMLILFNQITKEG